MPILAQRLSAARVSAAAVSKPFDEPDPAAHAHSALLKARIGSEIEAGGGWMPFSRYMELALYAPGLGYYAGGSLKLGRDGDFVTAPELTPLYAQALAEQVAQILERTGGDVL